MGGDTMMNVLPAVMPRPQRRELLWLLEGKKCHWCGCATVVTDYKQPDQATIDHVVLRYKGGLSTADNMVSACYRCNNRRNYEDAQGLPEGSLLGQYKTGKNWRQMAERVALTGAEKKAIINGVPLSPVVPRQATPALKELVALRNENASLREQVKKLQTERREMTMWKLLQRRIGFWLIRRTD